jgi:mono/diheme cytochrome c family protein
MSSGLLAIAVSFGSIAGGRALADDPGKTEYLNSCASCHGLEAKGDGSLAAFLTVKVPDLTTLAARNDGVFPMASVLHIIDGRRCGPVGEVRPCARPTDEIAAHGTPMPVWGNRFKEEAVFGEGSGEPEVDVRGRVLSLAYYLESIQK